MQTYKIKNIRAETFGYLLDVARGQKDWRLFGVYYTDSGAKRLRIGDRVTVLRDKYLDIESFVYLYRGGMSFHTKPPIYDKWSCKEYINTLPGVVDGYKLDRAVFKIALVCECLRRGIPVSHRAWHNLQNLMMAQHMQNNKIGR